MQLIANEDELQEIKARRRGYLVNVWPGQVVIVHNLEHLCPQAQAMNYLAYKPRYFAETRQEINTRPSPWGQVEIRDCSLCGQTKKRRH